MTFLQYLQSKDLFPSTIQQYTNEIHRYEVFLIKKGKHIDTAIKKDIIEYLKYPHRTSGRKQLSNKTKATILGIINHFYNYMIQHHDSTHNPAQHIKIRATKTKHLYHLFTFDELVQFCDLYYSHIYLQIIPPTPIQQKHYISLTLAAFQGLHLREIHALAEEHFDLRKATLTIPPSHKVNGRILPLQAAQIGVIMSYFEQHEWNNTAQLNTTHNNTTPHHNMRKLHPKYMHFKQLRASIITHWIKTHGLRKAQYRAGHKYISSTEHYLDNDFESLQKDLDNFHPLS